jgi:uncharacterized membrane protein
MPYCGKCGATISEGSTFCPQCGQPAGPSGGAGQPASAGNTGSGLAENVAGPLCYVFGWITGLVFLLIDKRPFVRFHAAQSIVVFGGLHIVRIGLGIVLGVGWMGGGWIWTGFTIGAALISLIGLLSLVLWILLMVKAFQGERFRVPIAADFADTLVGKVKAE